MRPAHALGILSVVALAGCELFASPPPPPPQDVIVRVTGGADLPLEGVLVRAGAGASGKTDSRGFARLKIDGEDGTKVDLAVTCPLGYAPPANLAKITVRRASRPPELDVPCRRLEHAVVVAFRTSGSAVRDVPILYLGHELTRTDAQGYALVTLEPKVGETLKFTFDTSDPKLAYLRPQNPEVSVLVPDADEAFTLEQKFVEDRPAVKHAPKKKTPIAIELRPDR